MDIYATAAPSDMSLSSSSSFISSIHIDNKNIKTYNNLAVWTKWPTHGECEWMCNSRHRAIPLRCRPRHKSDQSAVSDGMPKPPSCAVHCPSTGQQSLVRLNRLKPAQSWRSGTLVLRAERQSAWMSEILKKLWVRLEYQSVTSWHLCPLKS